MRAIDLNADVGELDPDLDARIMEVVTSVSIACGGHAGNDATMTTVSTLAAQRGVRVGAHPSYLDREGFGRTRQDVAHSTLTAQVRDQIQRLASCSPVPVGYVKPHGALYHAAAQDEDVARALVNASDGLPLMGQPSSHYIRMAQAAGIPVILEAFADRAYSDEGHLVPRTTPGAVMHEEHAVLAHVAGLARGRVTTVSGRLISVEADSICLHSDTPGAADLARLVAQHLEQQGVRVAASP